MRCPYCKAEINGNDIVCSKCGYKLPGPGEKVRVRWPNYIFSQIAILGAVLLIIGFFSSWIFLMNTEVSGLYIVTIFFSSFQWIATMNLGANLNNVLEIARIGTFLLWFLPLSALLSLFALWNKRWAVWLTFISCTLGLIPLAILTGVIWYLMQKSLPPIRIGFWLTWIGLLWLWLATLIDLIGNRRRVSRV